MALKIYNSLINRKEEFKPIAAGEVKMYVCGVTVYDKCHIGHARGAFVFDVVRDYLTYKRYEVTYVKNITDVDDKIINKAAELVEEYKKKGINKTLNEAVEEITACYIDAYYEDMDALGIKKADIEPRATEHIDDMIKMIEGLIEKGYAYEVDGDVYFDVKKYKDYGQLSNQSVEELQEGVRKEVDKKKRSALDFALWKKVKEHEPHWQSPFSNGRPGWHLECSAMSIKYLGDNFDIHGGGRDLIFPHHENEIAQAECYTGKPFANVWMHNGLLTVEGQKMAKSLGNFVTISEIIKKYHPETLKLLFLLSHYASPVDFTFEKMDEARTARKKFYSLFEKIENVLKDAGQAEEGAAAAEEAALKRSLDDCARGLEKASQGFIEAMDDDFNTPTALSRLFDIVNLINKFIRDESVALKAKVAILKSAKFTLKEFGGILGLFQKDEKNEAGEEMELLNKVMAIILDIRQKARQGKNFELSDSIRERLEDAGLILEDEKGKTVWRKK
ncbi:MAG: cysteine--tRNA ligase [Candidatus Omnitrophica bacterium]|nr:cysteine--tRNA ligase [Candidatus Omnitrophota bacterium]